MSPVLSVLDPSPVFKGRSPSTALQETRALAEACDTLGYRSYWVQEHHNATSFAGTAPEILMADLAGRTRRLVLGSGGIMLPNYSPLKVAEIGQTLSALYPGRIELGIGRATGADPRTSAALLGPGAATFPTMLRLLMDWVLDASGEVSMTADHRAKGIAANPAGPRPDLWVLCSSPSSAAFIGEMGLKMAFADFLSPGGASEAVAAYRSHFKPSPFCAAPYAAMGRVALAAPTEAKANHLAHTLLAWSQARQAGRFEPYLTAQDAKTALQTSENTSGVRKGQTQALLGTGHQVAKALLKEAKAADIDEVFVLTVADSLEARIESYSLIMSAMAALRPQAPAPSPNASIA